MEWNKENALLDANTRFIINENPDDVEESEYLDEDGDLLSVLDNPPKSE